MVNTAKTLNRSKIFKNELISVLLNKKMWSFENDVTLDREIWIDNWTLKKKIMFALIHVLIKFFGLQITETKLNLL